MKSSHGKIRVRRNLKGLEKPRLGIVIDERDCNTKKGIGFMLAAAIGKWMNYSKCVFQTLIRKGNKQTLN